MLDYWILFSVSSMGWSFRASRIVAAKRMKCGRGRTDFTPDERKAISKDRAIEIGVHALVEVAKIDAMVDDSPQIAILEQKNPKSSLEIMNRRNDGTFDFECAEIKKIIDKIAGIEEKRTRAFHPLLDGNQNVKKKFDKALKEYSDGAGHSEGKNLDTTQSRPTARKRRKGPLHSRGRAKAPSD